MSRTIVCEQLSADELALVKKAAKAHPRPERHALRELLVAGARAALAEEGSCKGCASLKVDLEETEAELDRLANMAGEEPEVLEGDADAETLEG